MRRLSLVLLTSSLLLVACTGSGSKVTVTCKEQFWNGSVGTCLPTGWKVVPRETLTERGLPQEVVAAFQREQSQAGQSPVLLITKQTLAQDVDPAAYSDASIRSVTDMPGYKEIDTRNVTIDGQKVKIHIFSAQPNADEPARRFYQLSTSTKGAGYTYTALTPLSVDKTLDAEVLLMLQNATLVQQGGGQ